MFVYKGGQKVGKGTYWNIANGSRIESGGDERLPGKQGTAYLRMAPGMMLLVGPVMGMIYFIALPILTIGMVIQLTARKVWGGLTSLVGHLAYFEWRPTESYLTGEKKRKQKGKKS